MSFRSWKNVRAFSCVIRHDVRRGRVVAQMSMKNPALDLFFFPLTPYLPWQGLPAVIKSNLLLLNHATQPSDIRIKYDRRSNGVPFSFSFCLRSVEPDPMNGITVKKRTAILTSENEYEPMRMNVRQFFECEPMKINEDQHGLNVNRLYAEVELKLIFHVYFIFNSLFPTNSHQATLLCSE